MSYAPQESKIPLSHLNRSVTKRRTKKVVEWRTKVFKRDNYTCIKCNKPNKYLNAHHICPYAYYKRLRYDINNGATLCSECHKLLHSSYTFKDCNKKTFSDFLKKG